MFKGDYHWGGDIKIDAGGGATMILWGFLIVLGVICIVLLLGAIF